MHSVPLCAVEQAAEPDKPSYGLQLQVTHPPKQPSLARALFSALSASASRWHSWPAYWNLANKTTPYATVAQLCNLWREYYDIQDTYESWTRILDYQDQLAPWAGPGHWCALIHEVFFFLRHTSHFLRDGSLYIYMCVCQFRPHVDETGTIRTCWRSAMAARPPPNTNP